MRKLVSALLVLIMVLLSVSSVAELDYASLTDEELNQIIIQTQNELKSRNLSEDESALERDGYFTIKVLRKNNSK